MSNNNINLKVDVDYTELTGLIKTTDQTKRALSLVSKEFANTKDQGAWMRGVNQIIQAQKKLDVSARMSRSEIMKMAHEMKQASQFSNALSDATASAAVNTQLLGKRTSRFGVLAQQTGYQVGDFAVQIQSGQNAMVAFGQQATQLIGTFSMLTKSTKMISLFAGLGILVPILTGIGAAFLRAGDSSKTFEDSLKNLTDAVSDYSRFVDIADSDTKTLSDRFGSSSQSVIALAGHLKEFARVDALDKMKSSVTELSESFGGLSDDLVAMDVTRGFWSSLIDKDSVSLIKEITNTTLVLSKELNIAKDQASAVAYALKEFSQAEGFESQASSAENLNRIFLEVFGSVEKIPEELRVIAKNAALVALSASEMGEGMSNYEKALGRIVNSQEQQLALAKGVLNYGKDSLEVATLRARQEAINKGLLADDLQNYIDLALEIRDVVAATEQMAKNQEVLKEGARGFLSIWESISQKVGEAVGKMALAPSVAGGRGQDPRQFTYLDEFRSQLQDDNPEPKTPRGGGASQQDPLAKLRDRIKLDTELLGKTKERQEVERAIANSKKKYSKDAIDQAVAELAAYNQIVEKRQELQGIYDTAQSSMEDGFMAMVEGTKSVEDAFKDMARSIIKELYQVYVIKRMVGGFGMDGASGSGILGGVQKILGFDGGGYTGSGPRSGGMDGRGGYLAMLHPRETVVDHTKAGSTGGSGDVYVTNNFTMAANGDDSVKKIIAQSMPAIVNASKQGVMDARRRGGAMKNTFG